jgi:zinc ribbon protein
MFCPKCATQNLEGASFCRTCGANISLVPQALTGQPLQDPPGQQIIVEHHGRRRERRNREPTLDAAFKHIFMGIAFLIISIALSRSMGQGWWFWLLIPAFSLMGQGIAQFIRVRERDRQAQIGGPQAPQVGPPNQPATFARRTDELRPPVASVTEGTTRHLGVEAPTRHLDTVDRK